MKTQRGTMENININESLSNPVNTSPETEEIIRSPSLAHLVRTTAKLCRETDTTVDYQTSYSDPVSDRIKDYVLRIS